MRRLVLIMLWLFLFLSLLVSISPAASTETWGKKFVSVTWSSSLTDWVCSRNIIPVRIFFTPSAANDVFVLREGSIAGPEIVKSVNVTGDTICIPLWGSRDESWLPCVKAADQTFSAFANVVLTVEFK